jgi:hypothetical protein
VADDEVQDSVAVDVTEQNATGENAAERINDRLGESVASVVQVNEDGGANEEDIVDSVHGNDNVTETVPVDVRRCDSLEDVQLGVEGHACLW